MSADVYFISDLHFDHNSILDFSPDRYGDNLDEHNEWLIASWNSMVRPKDVVWVLGDFCFGKQDRFTYFAKRLTGNKNIVLGNHDSHIRDFTGFSGVYGLNKKYGFWLSHAPVHPQELRGLKNIHGHVHHNPIQDPRYVNVCVETCAGVPISLESIRSRYA